MIGFYFSPQLKDTESSFLDYLAAFQMLFFFLFLLLVSKIIKVKVVGYVFLGLCNLTCVKDLGGFLQR